MAARFVEAVVLGGEWGEGQRRSQRRDGAGHPGGRDQLGDPENTPEPL